MPPARPPPPSSSASVSAKMSSLGRGRVSLPSCPGGVPEKKPGAEPVLVVMPALVKRARPVGSASRVADTASPVARFPAVRPMTLPQFEEGHEPSPARTVPGVTKMVACQSLACSMRKFPLTVGIHSCATSTMPPSAHVPVFAPIGGRRQAGFPASTGPTPPTWRVSVSDCRVDCWPIQDFPGSGASLHNPAHRHLSGARSCPST